MKKQNDMQRLFEVMSRLDKTFKFKLNENIGGNPNIIQNKYNILTIDKPIIPDAIAVAKNNPKAVEFHDKQQFDEFLNRQQYFSASESHAFQSVMDMNNNVPDGNSHLLFETGHEIVAVWDNQNKTGFIIPSERQKKEVTENATGMDEYLPITTPIGSEDDKMFVSMVNQGIDSHLEGFTKSKFSETNGSLGKRRVFNFHKSELPILLRRLEELGTEEALQWKDDIENYDSNINEIANTVAADKRIATTYQIATPESSEQGDYADQGWEDEEGESMIPDEYEVEEGITAIDKAVEFLQKRGSVEPSSSQFHTGVWYQTIDPDHGDYRTNEEKYYSFHLKGFTPEEEAQIFEKIKLK